jgi:outer membrane protein TolC
MLRTSLAAVAFCLVALSASAQTPSTAAQAPATIRLTVDEAVRLALEHNPDLKADRLDPQISDTRVAVAAGAFKPSFSTSVQRNNQLQPPAGFLVPTPTRTDAVTSNAGLSQRLPWFGTTYSVSWSAIHTDSNSFLNSYNPLLQSGLAVNVSQPLVRDIAIDNARQQLATSRINRDIADTRLRESIVRTTANVKSAYWNLVAARANVDARQKALDLARELARVNAAKVNVGQSPPLDLVSAQAEVASDEEQLIVAETTVKQAEDQLRTQVLDTTDPDAWTATIETVDTPPVSLVPVDVNGAVAAALRDRGDLARARKDIESSRIGVSFAGNQRLPDVRLNAAYQASGLGGTEVIRSGGFPGTVVGSGAVIDFGSVLGQLFGHDYPTWTVGVSVSYPLGQSAEDASYARARLEQAQAEERLKSAEVRVVQQIRDAAWKIEMNAKRIDSTRAARELAEQRLDAEQKRYEVGLSTNFLVIQAQRDLAQAKTNELSAVLAYDLALVDFEALQQAGPAGSTGSATSTTQAVSAPASAVGAPTIALPAISRVPGAAATVSTVSTQ